MRMYRSFPVRAPTQQVFWPLYDYMNIGQNEARRLTFFEFPMGAINKTDADTNLYHHGRIPDGNSFFMSGLRLLFIPDWPLHRMRRKQDERDVRRFLSTGVLRFIIQNRVYISDGPLYKFPACFPTYDRDQEFLRKAIRTSRRIRLARQAYYAIQPLMFDHNVTFRVEIDHLPNWLDAPARVGVIIDGRMNRPE